MTPYYSDEWLTVFQGDCREVMASMEPASIHCVVTSPPYWGLRDYGTEGQLGLEATPEAYVANMVAVFREISRVLRDDGTVWLNLGDSYIGGGRGGANGDQVGLGTISGNAHASGTRWGPPTGKVAGYKSKDLVGIPWMVAFALRADGWYLRSDIIWSKPNPMPESVTDRPTKSHEYLFLLSKSSRYYFDAKAVRDEYVTPRDTKARMGFGSATGKNQTQDQAHSVSPGKRFEFAEGRNIRSVWTVATQPYPGAHFATFLEKLVEPCVKAGCSQLGTVLDPFAGSGTTGRVAQRLGRRAVLIDLNGDYLVQAMRRNQDIPLGLETA